MKDSSRRTDFWDPIKYVRLGRDDFYFTFAGEVRYRLEGYRIDRLDTDPVRDNYLLQRYLFSSDLHLTRRFRLFSELQSGIISGRVNGPRPADQNSLDLHQAFVDIDLLRREPEKLLLRVGRQELDLNSGRLISASEGLNVKRSFDGIRLGGRYGTWSMVGTAARLVAVRTGFFDDPPSPEQTFWGFSAVRRNPLLRRSLFGLHYMGLDRAESTYRQGKGPEQRHTVGARAFGREGNWDLNYELIGQWGTFQGSRATGWAASTETAYAAQKLPLKPRFVVRVDVASGDQDPQDPSLQSFNPLFPGTSYSGPVGLLGPTNLVDFSPGIQFQFLKRRLFVGVDGYLYWRQSTQDSVYDINVRPLTPTIRSDARHVGNQIAVIVRYSVDAHLHLQASWTRFFAGKYMQAPGSPVPFGLNFTTFSATYTF